METVLFEKQGHIAYITLNRPERMNAANLQLIRDLVQAKREFEDDPDLWVAILTGAGRAFCAGADLRRDQNDPDAAHNPASLQEKLEKTLTRHYKPMIAAVNGHCYGRGFAFTIDCDIRIASDQAVFCFAEPRWNFAERWVPKLAASIPPPPPRRLPGARLRQREQRARHRVPPVRRGRGHPHRPRRRCALPGRQ